jgi:hypothetical protein
MLKIEFKLNGKKFNPNDLKSIIEKDMIETIKKELTKSVGKLKCKKHGESPKIEIVGKTLKNLSFKVSGCCQEFIDEVDKKIK